MISSDNATCFKNEEVGLSEELLGLGINWKYIVPDSPWWGGMYERLIKSMKLNRIIFRASIAYEGLLTIVIEIEAIMNSRPEIHLRMGKRIIDSHTMLWMAWNARQKYS